MKSWKSRFGPEHRHARILDAYKHGLKEWSDEKKVAFEIFREDLEWFRKYGRKLRIVPLELKEANEFVEQLHRHHKKVQGHRFSVGCVDEDGVLRGAATVGRPVARNTNAKEVLEITRCVSDGTANVCSALYRAAARVGKELGYKKVQTFILESEDGGSLKAAGFEQDGTSPGGSWSVPSRPRDDKAPLEAKTRWAVQLN